MILVEVEDITLGMGNQMLVPAHELCERDALEHESRKPITFTASKYLRHSRMIDV